MNRKDIELKIKEAELRGRRKALEEEQDYLENDFIIEAWAYIGSIIFIFVVLGIIVFAIA